MCFVSRFCDGNSLAALREYNRLYPDWTRRSVIWEKQALSCGVQGQNVGLWLTSHAAIHQPELKRTACSDCSTIHSASESLVAFLRSQYKDCSQGTNMCTHISLVGCFTELRTSLNFCTVCCALMRQYLEKWRNTQPECMDNSKSSHLITAWIQSVRFGWNCGWLRNGTVRNTASS
jgi:hypothetical protein